MGRPAWLPTFLPTEAHSTHVPSLCMIGVTHKARWKENAKAISQLVAQEWCRKSSQNMLASQLCVGYPVRCLFMFIMVRRFLTCEWHMRWFDGVIDDNDVLRLHNHGEYSFRLDTEQTTLELST